MREEGGIAIVNSRDVAEHFEKRHADVLRDINNLTLNADLRSVWFRRVSYVDATGRDLPSFDMTRPRPKKATVSHLRERGDADEQIRDMKPEVADRALGLIN